MWRVIGLWLLLVAPLCAGDPIRVTTWNLQWFPNGSPKEVSAQEQQENIKAAADIIRALNPDVLLLQEIKDYSTCVALAEAIGPNTYQVCVCSAFREVTGAQGKQQVAILAKKQGESAWSETWKRLGKVDPPRGFAFAWVKFGGKDVGFYSVHLKSNLIMRGDRDLEHQLNILKRELATEQLVAHLDKDITTSIPTIRTAVIGGDFNTNTDQEMFASERTFENLTAAGFRNCFEGLPLKERITHPANNGYPPATFDYLFTRKSKVGAPVVTPCRISDHFPVTVEITPE